MERIAIVKEKDNLKEKDKRPAYEPPRARDLTAFPVYVTGACNSGNGPNPPTCQAGSGPFQLNCANGAGA
jgi:hypothetical protein